MFLISLPSKLINIISNELTDKELSYLTKLSINICNNLLPLKFIHERINREYITQTLHNRINYLNMDYKLNIL